MIDLLKNLTASWEKEAAQYTKSSSDSGLVDGANPQQQTAYQSQCATSASIYLGCAKELKKIITSQPITPL